MMQKNLTCKNIKESQHTLFLVLQGFCVFVNALFLLLGGLLMIFAQEKGIDIAGNGNRTEYIRKLLLVI